jgi:uncharacterized cofD-like protein
MDKKKIVVIGGGTGTHTVLSGLKKYADRVELSAIVAMTDSGGSTGRLRDEFGYLPVGDVRMALAALASEDDEHDALVRKLFLHRFETNGDISGHNFGNLFLMALTDLLGSEERAIHAASRVLRVCGTVVPVTHEKVNLVAEYANGRTVIGEHEIDEPQGNYTDQKIIALRVTPHAALNPKVVTVLSEADLIIFGPGDLYTSVLANCVVDGFSQALTDTHAQVLYISNLMTKAGQTTGMGLQEHIEELARYSGRMPDSILVNNAPLPEELLQKYAAESEYPVSCENGLTSCTMIQKDLLSSEEIVRGKGDVLRRSLIRHDSNKLAQAILDLL